LDRWTSHGTACIETSIRSYYDKVDVILHRSNRKGLHNPFGLRAVIITILMIIKRLRNLFTEGRVRVPPT